MEKWFNKPNLHLTRSTSFIYCYTIYQQTYRKKSYLFFQGKKQSPGLVSDLSILKNKLYSVHNRSILIIVFLLKMSSPPIWFCDNFRLRISFGSVVRFAEQYSGSSSGCQKIPDILSKTSFAESEKYWYLVQNFGFDWKNCCIHKCSFSKKIFCYVKNFLFFMADNLLLFNYLYVFRVSFQHSPQILCRSQFTFSPRVKIIHSLAIWNIRYRT